MNKFIILFPGRTGSTYLRSRLRAHPNLYVDRELINGRWITRNPGRRKVERRRRLVGLFDRGRGAHIKAVGFKTKILPVVWNATDLNGLRDTLEECGLTHAIALLRRNRIKHGLSYIRARIIKAKGSRYNLTLQSGHLQAELRKIPVDPVRLEAAAKIMEERERYIRKFFARLTWAKRRVLYYEDLLADRDAFIRRLYRFLGVGHVETRGEFVKATDNDLRRAIPNYREVRRYFAGTPYERFF